MVGISIPSGSRLDLRTNSQNPFFSVALLNDFLSGGFASCLRGYYSNVEVVLQYQLGLHKVPGTPSTTVHTSSYQVRQRVGHGMLSVGFRIHFFVQYSSISLPKYYNELQFDGASY